MSSDISRVPVGDLEEALRRLYEVGMPPRVAETLDQRIDAAVRTRADGGSHRIPILGQHRVAVVIAITVLSVTVAAAPVVRFFQDWGEPYDQIFELATPIEQSVTDQGYRVTLVRAYGDAYSVRLAMAVEDLDDRGWAEIDIAAATVRDAEGAVYAPESGTFRQLSPESSESWYRFGVPQDARDGERRLSVDVGVVAARREPAPTLANGEVDFDRLWTRVDGSWSFEFDLAFFEAVTARPAITATHGGVSVTLEELGVTPAATVGRLSITGLPEVPADWAWDPYIRVEHDGEELDLDMLAPGSVTDRLSFEAHPGFADLSGEWKITIDEFHRDIPDPDSDVTTEADSLKGPWVLSFDGPAADR